MGVTATPGRTRSIVAAGDLQHLLDAIARRGYRVVGPTVHDGAIVLDEIGSVGDLPAGWTDRHENGRYRLEPRQDGRLFGFNLGPHSWKSWLHPPRQRLWHATKDGGAFEIVTESDGPPKLAFLGIRACEVQALLKVDTVLTSGDHTDPIYTGRRACSLVVAVTCGEVGSNCFCDSMGAGPLPRSGYDLCLTEVVEGKRHYFVSEAGSTVGAEVLSEVPTAEPDEKQVARPEAVASKTAAGMSRKVDLRGLKQALYASHEHPHWDDVAARCLTCGNCTSVCPTCFCTTVEDTTDLGGAHAERTRRWDSCFTMDFSFINGGSVRYSPAARYRQWLTHKFASWEDQFGSPGCVGCGRCITWCPAGIDITEELGALRKRAVSTKESSNGDT